MQAVSRRTEAKGMRERKRWGYLDILKAVAMICVCLYHFPMIRHTAYVRPFPADTLVLRYFRGCNAVCVPLMMMVNGALLLNRPFDLKKHAVRTLWLAAGAYVWYIVTIVLGHAWQNGLAYVAQNIKGILLSAQYLYGYDGIQTTHMWFAPMLAALYLLVPLVRAAFDSTDAQLRKGLAFFVLGIGVCGFLLQDIAHIRAAVPVLRSLDLSGMEAFNPLRGMYGAMLVYFILGGYLHRRHEMLLRVPAWLCAVMILGGSAALFAEWYLVTIRTEAMYDIVYGGYSCLPTLTMAAGMFIAAARIEARLQLSEGRCAGVIRLVGRNTLAVYYLHWIVGLTLMRLVDVPGGIAVNLIKAALQVLLCALAGEALRRVPVVRRLL